MMFALFVLFNAAPAPAETLFDAGRVREFVATREVVARTRFESALRVGTTTAADLRTLRAQFPHDGRRLTQLARELKGASMPPPRDVTADGDGYRVTTAFGRTFRLAARRDGVRLNDRPLVTTNLTAYLASVERGLRASFATAWWRALDPLPFAHAGPVARILVAKVAAAAIRLIGLWPQVALNSTGERARATTLWFNQKTAICQQEADQRVPFEESETRDNVEGLAGQAAFAGAGAGAPPVSCAEFVKRALAASAPSKDDLSAADAQGLCASAQAFSACLRDYHRRDAGGTRVEPVNATPSGR